MTDNSNRLALWFNDKREKQTHPHLKGQGETDSPVWVSAWFDKDMDPMDAKALMGIIKRHKASTNKPLLSISIQAKEEKRTSKPAAVDYDDDLPF